VPVIAVVVMGCGGGSGEEAVGRGCAPSPGKKIFFIYRFSSKG